MGVFNRANLNDFSHKGWVAFCPVYVGLLESDAPTVVERNWIPEFVLTLAIGTQDIYLELCAMVNYQPACMLITGEIQHEALNGHP